MNTLVDKEGNVFCFDGDKKVKVEPGWEKCWIFENVYGWMWVGPFRFDNIYELIILGHEPNLEERKSIALKFKGVEPPNGENLFRYPNE